MMMDKKGDGDNTWQCYGGSEAIAMEIGHPLGREVCA